MKRLQDITSDIGPLHQSGAPAIPMYSFDRPATILWQAVYDGMRAGGCTHEQATEWLQSKGPRWMLDGTLGEQLEALGHDVGSRCAPTAKAETPAVG
jgi:hypothetical protein